MDKTTAATFARSYGWLASTPQSFQDGVIRRADLIRLDAGQPLYAAGDDAGGLFCLVEGRLDIHLTTMGNKDTLVLIGQPGIWIGDIAAVTGQRRLMTIVARNRCAMLRLPRAEMLRILEEMPGAWSHVAEMLAQNFARALEIIEYMRCPDPARRVAGLLLTMTGNRDPIPIAASQQEIAEMTHLSRTTVQAALTELTQSGLVRHGYASIEIVDVGALRTFACSPDDL